MAKQSIKLLTKIMLIGVVIPTLWIPACIGLQCSYSEYVWDYYGEYKFLRKSIPFDNKPSTDRGSFYFSTTQSINQMIEQFNKQSNTQATLIKDSQNSHSNAIFLSISQNNYAYYFLISSSDTINEKRTQYEVVNCSYFLYWLNFASYDIRPNILFPFYAIRELGFGTNGDMHYSINISWNDLVAFYQNIGKDDFEIDHINNIIRFDYMKHFNINANEIITIQYLERIDGNRVYIDSI